MSVCAAGRVRHLDMWSELVVQERAELKPSSGWTRPKSLNKASLCCCKEQIFICMWHFGSKACNLEGF